jgi:glycosyltransferase involved in cell wall biosynthesis
MTARLCESGALVGSRARAALAADRAPHAGAGPKVCLLIPIYQHGSTIRGVIHSLAEYSLPCFVVNDGSDAAVCAVLDSIEEEFDWVEVEHHAANRGKGAALRDGYRLAASRGFTHVIQLDADAQHDAADVARFLEAARKFPDTLVLGRPLFDQSAPKSRVYGRRFSQGLVWLATLSRQVRDPLCGFRCIPLAPTLALMDRIAMGDRMEFEPELAVRLVWEGVPVVNVDTRVRYYPGGISHFDVLWDDLRLAWLYTRLSFGMFMRARRLLARRDPQPR